MPVYNAYFKVIKKNLVSLLIYFFVFVMMAFIFFGLGGSSPASASFTATKTNIAFFNEDNTPLVDGLKESLSQNANFIPVSDKTESIQDALFYGKIDYVLRIPEGFTDDFLSSKDEIQLQRTARPMNPGSISVDMLVNKYLNLSRFYLQNIPGITASEVAENVHRDLNVSTAVELKSSEVQIKTTGLADVFRYLAYPILAVLLMGITSIMMAFNDPEMQKRNQCAPLSPFKMSIQLFMGNTVFALIVWAVLCVISLSLYAKAGLNTGAILLCINALVFMVFCVSIAFLAGKFIKSAIVQAATTNVVSLGVCFLSGVFLDQYLMGDTVLKIASFTPGFWYVKAVNAIKELTSFNFDSLKPIFGYMLIQLAFAAACIIIALVASKQKRQNMEK